MRPRTSVRFGVQLMDLSVRIGSLKLKNPLIAASGCFGYGVEYADRSVSMHEAARRAVEKIQEVAA